MSIGKTIRELRHKAELTQKELAELSGVNRVTINAIENGYTKSPSVDVLMPLASAFGLTIDEIMVIVVEQ